MPADFTNRQDRVKGHGVWYKHASDKQDTELLVYSFALLNLTSLCSPVRCKKITLIP